MRQGVLLAALGSLALVFADPVGFGHSRTRAQRFKGNGARLKEATTCDNVQQLWFTGAVVDNFAAVEDQVFWAGNGQRYFYNDQFWGGVGYPIWVFIGGEGAESCSRLTSRMYAYTQAKNNQALMIDLEHRYYGQSYPTVDMSNDNIKYLTSAQALADLARFIEWLKDDLGAQSSKVITVGGSYPGNLAAWFRLKYPHITSGSIASSAPVVAQENFPEYMEVVADAMVYFSGQSCYDAFEAAAEAVQAKINTNDLETLEADFKTCKPLDGDKDVATLLSMLMGNVQGTVQYNNEKKGVMNVTNICATMTAGPDAYTQFVALNDLYLAAYEEECTDASYQDFIDYMNTDTFDGTSNYRQWYYQTCNEFGYFQTTDSEDQPFHSWTLLDLKYYTDVCSEVYGYTKSPQIDWMNDYYGARDIAGTNIVLPGGTIDPWHALSVISQSQLSMSTEYSIFIEPTAHCADLYAPSWDDPKQLTNARKQIDKYVAQWLSVDDHDDDDDDDDDDDQTTLIIAATAGSVGAVLAASGGYYLYRKNQMANGEIHQPLQG